MSARDFVNVRRRLRSQAKPRIPRHIEARWSAAGLTKFNVDDDVLRAMHEPPGDVPSIDIGALHAKRIRLRSALAKGAAARLLAEVDDEALSIDEIDAGLDVLRRDLNEVETAIAAADAAPTPVIDFDELRRRGGASLGSLWSEMTNGERVDALRALGAEVVVEPATGRRSPVAGRVKLRAPWMPLATAV